MFLKQLANAVQKEVFPVIKKINSRLINGVVYATKRIEGLEQKTVQNEQKIDELRYQFESFVAYFNQEVSGVPAEEGTPTDTTVVTDTLIADSGLDIPAEFNELFPEGDATAEVTSDPVVNK